MVAHGTRKVVGRIAVPSPVRGDSLTCRRISGKEAGFGDPALHFQQHCFRSVRGSDAGFVGRGRPASSRRLLRDPHRKTKRTVLRTRPRSNFDHGARTYRRRLARRRRVIVRLELLLSPSMTLTRGAPFCRRRIYRPDFELACFLLNKKSDRRRFREGKYDSDNYHKQSILTES